MHEGIALKCHANLTALIVTCGIFYKSGFAKHYVNSPHSRFSSNIRKEGTSFIALISDEIADSGIIRDICYLITSRRGMARTMAARRMACCDCAWSCRVFRCLGPFLEKHNISNLMEKMGKYFSFVEFLENLDTVRCLAVSVILRLL